jgi:putative membrane protein
MSPVLKAFLQRWLINTVAVLVAVYIVDGIHYQNTLDLFVATLVLGILNTFLRPLLMLLSLPVLLLTFGLFMLFINATVLYFVGFLLKPHFHVTSFWSAFWGALVISVVSLALSAITGTGNMRVKVGSGGSDGPPRKGGEGGGSGPVIDV